MQDVIDETFSVLVEEGGGAHVEQELLPGGKNKKVTEANKSDYVDAYIWWRLSSSLAEQLGCLTAGLYEIVPAEQLTVFSGQEMDYLLNGRSGITVAEWRENARYTGGYTAESPEVHIFWEGIHDFPQDFRGKLLRFATGSSKIPLDGFTPNFTLTKSSEPASLPRSHTCFNQLVLPAYASVAALKEALALAVENTEGFLLS